MREEDKKRRIKRVRETEIEEVPDENSEADDGKTKHVGGFDPGDVAKAPAKPPSPDTSDTSEDTSNRKVVIIFASAAVIGLLGLIFMLMNLMFLSIPLFIVAGIAIIVAVFAPIR